MRRRFILIALALALASCGDDGSGSGSGGGGGVTANQPPVFTSATAVTVPENTAGTVYTATANDPEGKAVTYTISGGADAARFTIGASGAVSFITPPDFEHPTDSDTNNTYLITVSASDGVNTVAQNVTITVSDVPGEGIQVRQFTRVDNGPTQMATIPGDRRFAVLTQTNVWLVDSVTGANSILMSVFLDGIGPPTACGMRIHTIAFSPNFATDRTLYAGGNANCDFGIFEIRRLQVDASGVVKGNGTRVLYGSVDFYDSSLAITRLDEMRFGPDGLLYVTTGDRSNDFGRTPGPRESGYARDLSSLAGKVLRIDVNGDDFPADPNRNYRIPAGNPFAGGGGAPEIFAYGFHLPMGIDFNGTDVLFADRGYGDPTLAPNPVHEIDLVRPADAGGDYGFYNCQGDRNFSGTGPCIFPTILPVIQASGSVSSELRYLIGGIVYNGPIVDLRGQYIFAFGGNGRTPSFWSVPVAQLTQGANLKLTTLRDRTADFQAVGGVLNDVMAMGKDLAGNAYILDSDGDIFVIAPPA